VFRRRSVQTPAGVDLSPAQPDTEPSDADRPARSNVTAPKAGPTPKRREAQATRRGPYQAPADRKAANRDSKERGRSERMRRSAAYQRGEQWALPAKDKGPVRALARDVVDSRRRISEYFLFVMIPIFVLIVVPQTAFRLIGDAVLVVFASIVIIEAYLVGGKVIRLAQERYPGESTRGVRRYAGYRAMQLRKVRIPKPRVSPGDQV
jgi:hypothetical protein